MKGEVKHVTEYQPTKIWKQVGRRRMKAHDVPTRTKDSQTVLISWIDTCSLPTIPKNGALFDL